MDSLTGEKSFDRVLRYSSWSRGTIKFPYSKLFCSQYQARIGGMCIGRSARFIADGSSGIERTYVFTSRALRSISLPRNLKCFDATMGRR